MREVVGKDVVVTKVDDLTVTVKHPKPVPFWQQAFVGLGGYGLFVFAQHMGFNPFWSVPMGGVVAAMVAALTAKVVFRLRAGYFAVGTWVVSEVIRIVMSNVSLLGGGSGQSLTIMARIPREDQKA